MMAKAKRISVRLNEKASAVLKAEHARGITTSEVINQLLAGGISNPEIELMRARHALTPLSHIQTLLEHAEEPLRSQLREEFHQLCRALNM